MEERRRITCSAARKGLLDDGALTERVATNAVESAVSPVAPRRVDAVEDGNETLSVDGIPAATVELAFFDVVVAAGLASA